jgi:hypothetical protein
MALPTWDDPSLNAGTMVRGALWLLQEVGEGNTFTKAQLRDAFPGISQADRRVRDLRTFGWVLHTNTEDASLMAEDQRFVAAGVAVWEPEARRAASQQGALSAKEKQAIMARDGFMCTVCGISGGEPYLDDSNQSAVLSVVKRETISTEGEEESDWVVACKRCTKGFSGSPARADQTLEEIKALDPGDQLRLKRWMARGRRGSTPLERAWNSWRQLPAASREEIRAQLG